jgi:uncharacterized protein (DUF885 family)
VTPIEELIRRHLTEACDLDPCLAVVTAGAPGGDRMTDYGPEAAQQRATAAGGALAALSRLSVTCDRDRHLASFLRDRLQAQQEFHASGEAAAELHACTTGPLGLTRAAAEAAIPADDADPATREDGWRTVRERLSALPAALAGYQQSLTAAQAAGRVAAARQVEACRHQCLRWADDGRDLADRYGDGPQQDALLAACDTAARAYTRFAGFLRDVLAPRAPRQQEAFGADRYRLWARYFIGPGLDLDELYDWGWTEFTRIEAELHQEAARLDPTIPAAEVITRLDRDRPAATRHGREQFRLWLQRLVDQTTQTLDGTQFTIPAPLHRLECRITGSGGVRYVRPSGDLTRPGRLWWGIPAGGTPPPRWRAYSYAYHEGVPGHHLQIGQAACTGDQLTRNLGLLGGTSPHQEGWALYAEQVMDELGYYAEPAARIGYLLSALLRAARVLLDIGLHEQRPIPAGARQPGNETWTPTLARQFLQARCHKGAAAEAELTRYLGRPAQALAYKVGERAWLDGRERARQAHGQSDLRRFHATALSLDALGLNQLRDTLSGT